MTLAVTNTAPETKALHGSLPLWVGVVIYAVLIVSGDRLLLDPDSQWQVTVGQWILDHHAVPHTDVYSFTMRGQPWISTQWLAQVLYAEVYGWFGWTGPVVHGFAILNQEVSLIHGLMIMGRTFLVLVVNR